MKAWYIPMSMNFNVKLFAEDETDKMKTLVIRKIDFSLMNITQCSHTDKMKN